MFLEPDGFLPRLWSEEGGTLLHSGYARSIMARHILAGGRLLVQVLTCLGALALVGCFTRTPPAVTPPPDPPSGEIQPGGVIAYEQLAEHLRFNTKSRMGLLRLNGRVVEVRGPVGTVERGSAGVLLQLGSARGSDVRAHFPSAEGLQAVKEGQLVHVFGTFAFRGDYLLLEDASLGRR